MDTSCLHKEIRFSFVRSSGAGGQHVNKVSTKVVLRFDIAHSQCLSTEEKKRISEKLSHKISKEGIFSLQVSKTRSQHKNKEIAITAFLSLFQKALREPKKRKPTKIPKSAKLKRLQKKKKRALIKVNRQKPKYE